MERKFLTESQHIYDAYPVDYAVTLRKACLNGTLAYEAALIKAGHAGVWMLGASELLEDGISYGKIASSLNRKKSQVYLRLNKEKAALYKRRLRYWQRNCNVESHQKMLRGARMQQGLTITELSHRLGWDRKTISKWENGLRAPSSSQLYDWALALGYKVNMMPIQDLHDQQE